MSTEIRLSSATGGQKGDKSSQYHVIPPQAMDLISRQFAYGSLKYEDHNFRKGYPWSLSTNALERHLAAFKGGEDYDEDGNPHLAAAAWHAIVLLQFWLEHPDYDDRWKFNPQAAERLAEIMKTADQAYFNNTERWSK